MSENCGITEEPRELGDYQWTARRTPDHDPPRWAVYRSGQRGPAGYLELVWSANADQHVLLVRNPDNSLFVQGLPPKRAESLETPEDASSVGSYNNALAWFEWRTRGLA